MKRIFTIILLCVVALSGLGLSAQVGYNFWLTTEGAGVQISNRHAPPPPPHRYHRYYAPPRHGSHHSKKSWKKYKKMQKARKKYDKARREYNRSRYHHH